MTSDPFFDLLILLAALTVPAFIAAALIGLVESIIGRRLS